MSGWAYWPAFHAVSDADRAALAAAPLRPDGTLGRHGCIPPAHFLAWYPRLTPLASAVAGRPLVPSRAYLALCTPAAPGDARWRPDVEPWLTAHQDDKAWTDWNLTIGLHAFPADRHWPLYVQGPGGRCWDLGYGPGDAICYRGRQVWHWRMPLPADLQAFAAVFFHFVEAP